MLQKLSVLHQFLTVPVNTTELLRGTSAQNSQIRHQAAIVRCLPLFTVFFIIFAIILKGDPAQAQGTVTGVSVTTNVSSVNTTITAPNPAVAGFGAGATTGTPKLDTEWQVTSGPTYSWSASPGTANPVNAPETTVTAPFSTPGTHAATVACTVTYQVIKSDPGQPDDGSTATISGSGSASVTVNVGVVWDPGLPIGQYFGTDGNGNSVILHNGQMIAPQSQTQSPPLPTKVGVLPGKQLPCSVQAATSLAHKSYPADDSSHQDYAPNPIASYVWSCSGGQFLTGTDANGNPQYSSTARGTSATWIAPAFVPAMSSSYSLSCTITDAPPPVVSPDTGTRGPKTTSVGCTVYILTAGVAVRRTGAVKPDPTDPNHARTLPSDFITSPGLAKVAAGAVSSSEHEGDIQITVRFPDGSPAPLGTLVSANGVIITGGQGPNDPPNNVTAKIKLGVGFTDADGHVVFLAAFTSGNRTENTVIGADLGGGLIPTATYNQVWDNGDAGHWNPDISDFYFDYGTPYPLTFSPAFVDENNYTVPITKHSISLVLTSMDLWKWDDTNQDYVFVPGAVSDPSLAWFDPSASADSGAGSYSASLNVDYDPNNIVDTVYVDAYDNGVFSNGN